MTTNSKQTDKPVALTRTRWQNARWVLQSGWFRTALAIILVGALTAAAWWQWPAISSAFGRVAEAFQPDPEPLPPIDFAPTPDPTVDGEVTGLHKALAGAISAATQLISTKRQAGVTAADLKPAEDAVAAAQAILDADVTIIPPLQARLDALNAATATLSTKTPPPPPPPTKKPTKKPTTKPGGGGGTTKPGNGGGSKGNTGGGSKGGGGSGTASTSTTLTCTGGTVRVTFRGTGGGTVKVTVSGPASGANSGSGSATVVITGPAGTYTAKATATGSVGISGSCG